MEVQNNHAWPLFVQDHQGHSIYLTWERWEHALGHPGMFVLTAYLIEKF